MQHSIGQAANVDVAKSLEVLASPGKPASDIPGHENSDHVLWLVGVVFRLAEVEKRALEAGLIHLWSPEVASTIMWFLRRWSLTYLAAQVRLAKVVAVWERIFLFSKVRFYKSVCKLFFKAKFCGFSPI